MPSRPIRFFHRGAVVEVDGAAPTRTVLDWLREDARCTGTKEGCNEGDCGACTVVIGELARAGRPDAVGGLRLRTANACIQFLPTLDGKALFTVEDLSGGRDGALHPVQQAMVECHGSQCGFCTPGFVMSLWATYQHHAARGTRPTRQQLADELSGNLCRCTGYRPILDAGERMFDLPRGAARHRAGVGRARRRCAPTLTLPLRARGGAELRSRRARSTSSPRRGWRVPRRASSPARPTSASGSTRCSAPCRAALHRRRRRAEAHRARATACSRSAPAPRSRTPGARWSRAGRR